jgi:hypothetical protein
MIYRFPDKLLLVKKAPFSLEIGQSMAMQHWLTADRRYWVTRHQAIGYMAHMEVLSPACDGKVWGYVYVDDENPSTFTLEASVNKIENIIRSFKEEESEIGTIDEVT